MRYTVRHDDAVLGTVDLAHRQFVAARLRPGSDYAAVGAIVRSATQAFLRIGLFYDADGLSLNETGVEGQRAVAAAARLRLTLTDDAERVAPTHFVNLLEPSVDGGIVVVACFMDDDVSDYLV